MKSRNIIIICLLTIFVLTFFVKCEPPNQIVSKQGKPPENALQVKEITLYFVHAWIRVRDHRPDTWDVLYVDEDRNFYLWNVPSIDNLDLVKKFLITR